jgi:hypothetical protein
MALASLSFRSHITMPDMTVDSFVQAVAALGPNGELVPGVDIERWCGEHGITIHVEGGPKNGIWWGCDLAEAGGQHRLLKFKVSATKTSPNFFALRGPHPRAPSPAGGHLGRMQAREHSYVECRWDPLHNRWDWEGAETPLP